MTVLDRQVLRDIRALRGQLMTIALLIGAGVAVLVMSATTFLSASGAQRAFYAQTRFSEVFAEVQRARRSLLMQVAELPGVAAVAGRVSGAKRVDWPDAEVPVAGRVLSLPARRQPALNRLRLVTGRLPDPARLDEAVIHAAFAEA